MTYIVSGVAVTNDQELTVDTASGGEWTAPADRFTFLEQGVLYRNPDPGRHVFDHVFYPWSTIRFIAWHEGE